jgi:alkanesulfonate monooxygenase SsuD/methylene tetrahydromethanopterin reductase-like flavin-dependent oxidoreductase (luciferase family)
MLAGSPGEIRDKVGRLREAGVDTVFIPTLFMKDPRPALDRFMKEIGPQFR